MNTANATFLMTALIIAVGYIMKTFGPVSEADGKAASRLVINITLPALLIVTIYDMEIDPALLLVPVISFTASLIICTIAFSLFKKNIPTEKGLAIMTSLGYNIGLFGFPIIESIFGKEALIYGAMFDIGNAFIVFGLAYYVGDMYSGGDHNASFDIRKMIRSLFKSIPFVSYILGIMLNLFSVQIPNFILSPLTVLASSNKALVLIVLGMMLNFQFERSHWKLILKITTLRYATGLILGAALYLLLPFDQLYRTIIFICLILPMPLSVIPFSVEFNYDPKLTGTAANIEILISFFLIWGIILLTGAQPL